MKTARVRSTRKEQSDPGLRPACKFRAGSQEMARKAAEEISGSMKMFADCVARDVPFNKIQADIQKLNPNFKGRILRPSNHLYFRLRADDFPPVPVVEEGEVQPPSFDAQILQRYGEKRPGDTENQLYSCPIALPSDDPDVFFQESFRAYKASGIHRWSEARVPGEDLQCMGYQADTPEHAKRKLYGTREKVSFGACEPNECQLFGAGGCKHHGKLLFFVPDIDCGLVSLTFTSIYACAGIVETTDQVRESLGSVAGTLDGLMLSGAPIFYLSKSLESVRMRNPRPGDSAVRQQQIVTLVPNWAGIREVERRRATKRLGADTSERSDPGQGKELVTTGATETEDDYDASTTRKTTPVDANNSTVVIKNLRTKRMQLAQKIGYTVDELWEYLESKGFTADDAQDVGRLAEQVKLLQGIISKNILRQAEMDERVSKVTGEVKEQLAAAVSRADTSHGEHSAQETDVDATAQAPIEGELFDDEENPF